MFAPFTFTGFSLLKYWTLHRFPWRFKMALEDLEISFLLQSNSEKRQKSVKKCWASWHSLVGGVFMKHMKAIRYALGLGEGPLLVSCS